MRWLLLVLGLLLPLGPAFGHEMRPSHLDLSPRADGRIDAVFRVAASGDAISHLELSLPGRCAPVGTETVEDAPRAVVRRSVLDCGPDGLSGLDVSVGGLAETGTELVVTAAGSTWVLTADAPSVRLPAPGSRSGLNLGWFRLGVEHIAVGLDHLAFVLGLWLLVGRNRRALAWTITAFTLAHSVTLGAAALGVVTPATRAVEAMIALSILLLARTLAAGGPPRAAPWVFAGACGLLHGFGFAGALAGLGFPEDNRLGALLLFNLGVEVGQLAFVVALEGARIALGRWRLGPWARPAVVHALGALGAFWFIGRTVAILAA